MISSWFVSDLILQRPNAVAEHIIQAVGSSSVEKGNAFVVKHLSDLKPQVYGSYHDVYNDPSVDIVYIGTPNAFHKQNCLDAIAAGKHVLCEKAFTLNAKEAEEVISAAKAKGTFLMEGMWTRFRPLVTDLRHALFRDKVIGNVRRTFCDFSLAMNILEFDKESRMRNPALGAGSLLDIGIYSLTWGLLTLDAQIGEEAECPTVLGTQTLTEGVDTTTSMLLLYPNSGRHGILTSSMDLKTGTAFARIEGTDGTITIEGSTASAPASFTVWPKTTGSEKGEVTGNLLEASGGKKHVYNEPGMGFYWEADAVALDIAAGRTEDGTMPLSETLRVIKLMDSVRSQGGAKFPQEAVA